MSAPDYSRVSFPSIRKLFKKARIQGPDQLIPVCYNGHQEEYIRHISTYQIEAPLDKVWDSYCSIHPAIAWNTQMIKFGFVFSRSSGNYTYDQNESYEGISKGQIFLINLNIIKSIQIAVAHEVDEVDNVKKAIKLCYLNTGKTAGSQWIRMKSTNNGKTIIEHKTLYKGSSYIRDRLLYPIFHERAMSQFHQSMHDLIMRDAQDS